MALVMLVSITSPLSGKNAREPGAEDMNYSAGWAVGMNFIPIACYILPYIAIEEIWKALDPACTDGQSRKESSRPRIIGYWWVFCIVSLSLIKVVFDAQEKGSFGESEAFRPLLTMGYYVLAMVFTGLTIYLVKVMTARREERGHAETRGNRYFRDCQRHSRSRKNFALPRIAVV